MPPQVLHNPPASTSKARLLIPATPGWFDFLPPLPNTSKPVASRSTSNLLALLDHATSLHASELARLSAVPNAAGGSASDQAFLRNILTGGTLSDRLSALTLMVQSAPLHNIRALESLKNLAERGRSGVSASREGEKGKGKTAGREDRLKAARAVMDWWVGGGAPNRKLRYFRDQPLLHPDVTDQHLIIWYFEDWLKKFFFSYLQILEAFSQDPLPYVRTQSLPLIATLLRSNPEQEQNLLRLLVNKLGDKEASICARTSYYLLHILQEHPAMKTVVINEAMMLVMRPTSPPSHSQPNTDTRFSGGDQKPIPRQEKNMWRTHAQYYAAITFNQIVLSTSEADRGSARKLMTVYFNLFRGIVSDRVSEPADDANPTMEESSDKRKGKVNKISKRKRKEVRGAAGFVEVQDSNAKLLSAILTGINRALPYARSGGDNTEFEEHVATLFLLVHTSTFDNSLQALTLIQQIVASFPASSPVVSRFYRALYATLLDPRLHTTRHQARFLNLLFKSLKADSQQARIMAFVKRFCQVLVSGFGGSEFVAGGLWLLGELFSVSPGLRTLVDKTTYTGVESESYDPYKREPQYAHAQSCALWELTTLLHHAHPTVALLARQLLSNEALTSSPDLTLYTLSHFLDRFVYKNPKKPAARGTSAMQPSTFGVAGGVRRVRAEVQEIPLNIDGWWRRGEAGVFFQRYFSQKHGREQARAAKVDKRKVKDEDTDTKSHDAIEGGNSSENSDEEEAAIWKAMKASMQRTDINDDGDVEHSIVDSDPDEYASVDTEGDQEGPSEAEDYSSAQWESDDGFSFGEASDADDLMDLDPEVPVALEQPGSVTLGSSTFSGGIKRKRNGPGKGDVPTRNKRPPTRDYAQMIEDDPENVSVNSDLS
ncbi:CBF/Mak21 family-domain-containing protein [Russula brevipes]|nr:CBF/Mak21 family-domain-containing protein [Russula brevipes]